MDAFLLIIGTIGAVVWTIAGAWTWAAGNRAWACERFLLAFLTAINALGALA